MTLQQLKYLLAIVDSGLNITAAAERLYTSQPGISKQLKLLEQELGMQLFTRKGKSLAGITPAGRDVVARARKIMREAQNIRSLAREMAGEEEGTLAIATTHTQARYVLPEVLREFRDRYPRINLELHQGTSEQIAELVAANRVDFVIATSARELFPGLVILPCYQWDRVILVPRGHPLARAPQPVGLPALAEHPLITYVFSSTGESSFKRAFAEQGLEPRVVFTARDADIIKTYVRMDMGVGIVASMAVERADTRDLLVLDAAGLFPRLTAWLGYRRDTVLRHYMVDFMSLFAPQLTPQLVKRVSELPGQAEVDALFAQQKLSLRSGEGLASIAD